MEPETKRTSCWWNLANSPLVLAILTGLLFAGGAKIYSDHQEAVSDRIERRAELGKLLAEYQHRVAALDEADSALNKWLGEKSDMSDAPKLDRSNPKMVSAWERAATAAGKKEQEAISGTGSYIPTDPRFKGISLQTLAVEIENTAGVPDIEFSALRMIGFLEAPPDVLWLFVRSYRDNFTRFGVSRTMLYISQRLPLLRGEELTEGDKRALGLRYDHSGEDLDHLKARVDRHAKNTLDRLEGK